MSLLAAGVALAGCKTTPDTPATPPPPAVAPDDPLLNLDFERFDQTAGSGWRILASAGRYLDAAQLIDAYIQRNPALEGPRRQALFFHAGQMYAFAEKYGLARERFLASLSPDESRSSPIRWNDYVRGTVAFLERDRPSLTFHRNQVADGPSIDGIKPNLNFLDSFLENFGNSYAYAYTHARPPAPSGSGSGAGTGEGGRERPDGPGGLPEPPVETPATGG